MDNIEHKVDFQVNDSLETSRDHMYMFGKLLSVNYSNLHILCWRQKGLQRALLSILIAVLSTFHSTGRTAHDVIG